MWFDKVLKLLTFTQTIPQRLWKDVSKETPPFRFFLPCFPSSSLPPHYDPQSSCRNHTKLQPLHSINPVPRRESASTLSCLSSCFGAFLNHLSACHSCLGSLFLPAVLAKYKRIALVDLVSPLRYTQPHRCPSITSRRAPVGSDTTQTLFPLLVGAVFRIKSLDSACCY